MLGRGIATLAVALALGTPAGATTFGYSSFHVLGDSLSDVGNVYDATLHQIPKSPPYYKGRFSNGPVWAEKVGQRFRKQGLPTSNEAWGGARAIGKKIDVPDLEMQAGRYLSLDSDRKGDRPLLALWAGSNDLIDSVDSHHIGRVGRRAAREVGRTADRLSATGVNDFLLFTLPDLGKVPKFAQGNDPRDARKETRGVRAFNRELGDQIGDLRDDGFNVTKVNIYRFLNEVFENPSEFGVRNVTTPCLDGDDNPCSRRQGRRRAFFDDLHPNFVMHRRIADTVLEALQANGSARAYSAAAPAAARAAAPAIVSAPAPVPLPPASGLLLAGIAGLTTLAYRRRSSRT